MTIFKHKFHFITFLNLSLLQSEWEDLLLPFFVPFPFSSCFSAFPVPWHLMDYWIDLRWALEFTFCTSLFICRFLSNLSLLLSLCSFILPGSTIGPIPSADCDLGIFLIPLADTLVRFAGKLHVKFKWSFSIHMRHIFPGYILILIPCNFFLGP